MDARNFGRRLKEMREQAGLTQPQLAQRSGLTKAGIANLEQGRREPSWSTVVALSRALNVALDEFLQEPSSHPEPQRGRPRKAPTEADDQSATPPPTKKTMKKRKGK